MPSEQQPTRRTRFLCWMLVIMFTSMKNSDSPCPDLPTLSCFTATFRPSSSFPCTTSKFRTPLFSCAKIAGIKMEL